MLLYQIKINIYLIRSSFRAIHLQNTCCEVFTNYILLMTAGI